MLKILVLICPTSVDQIHCNRDTAIDIIQSMRVSSPQQCGFMGQAMLAPTSLAPDPHRQFVKIICVRDATIAEAAAR